MGSIIVKDVRVYPGTKKNIVHSQRSMVSYPSPRVAGKLILRANQHSRQNYRMLSFVPFGKTENAVGELSGAFEAAHSTPHINRALPSLEAESYAKLRGKLYKGSAALGVTFASWRQSREMIINRYRQMSLQSDSFEQRANSILRMRGRKKHLALDKLGSQYLEMVFGWKPLLADIHAAIATVAQDISRPPFVKAQARTYVEFEHVVSNTPSYRNVYQYSGIVRVKRAARVEIENPNRWLQERAGLRNSFAVAWDLVPWSWVVNMFVNTGQLVNSVTDFAGLKFIDGTITTAYKLTCHQSYARNPNGAPSYGGRAAHEQDVKLRKLNASVRPPLVFKVPDLNWDLACIAASLFFQKFRRVERLVNVELFRR